MVQEENEELGVVGVIEVGELIVGVNIFLTGVEDADCSLTENVSFVSENVVFVTLVKSRLLGLQRKKGGNFVVFLSVLSVLHVLFFGRCRYSKLVVLITILIK